MAEPNKTAVPVEIPTASLQRVENALCRMAGVPISAANTKQAVAQWVMQATNEQEAREARQAAARTEAETIAKIVPVEGLS